MLSRIIGRLLISFPLPPFVPDYFSNSRLVRNDNSFEILIKKNFRKLDGSIIEKSFVENIELVELRSLEIRVRTFFKPLIFGDKEDEGRTLALALFFSLFFSSFQTLSLSLATDSRELVERDNKERIKIHTHLHRADHGLMYAPRQLSSNRRLRLANGRWKLPENSSLTLTTQPGRSSGRITTKADPFNLSRCFFIFCHPSTIDTFELVPSKLARNR